MNNTPTSFTDPTGFMEHVDSGGTGVMEEITVTGHAFGPSGLSGLPGSNGGSYQASIYYGGYSAPQEVGEKPESYTEFIYGTDGNLTDANDSHDVDILDPFGNFFRFKHGQMVFDLLNRQRQRQNSARHAALVRKYQKDIQRVGLSDFVELLGADTNVGTYSFGGELIAGAGPRATVSTNNEGAVKYNVAYALGGKVEVLGSAGALVYSTKPGGITGVYQSIEFCWAGCVNYMWNYDDLAISVSIGISGGLSFSTGYIGDP